VPIRADLSEQCVLVLGASSGLGREIGLEAARAGARVAFAARRMRALEAAADRAGPGAIAVPCDVRNPDQVRAAVAEAAKRLGRLDGLVYASGMSPLAMLEEANPEEWRDVLETNVVGASLVTAAALPHLRNSQGRAIYISSYAVRQSLPGLGLYSVSKVALDALIDCWRVEHPDLDFTRVVVGNTADTEFANAWDPERTKEVIQIWVERNMFPSATMMPVAAVAEAVVAVLGTSGYVDDIAVMPRVRDASANPE